jgi:hypothetical protein
VLGLLETASGDESHFTEYSLPLEGFFLGAVCQLVFAESNLTVEASQSGFRVFLGGLQDPNRSEKKQ